MSESKICPSCKEQNNPTFTKCWKCGGAFSEPLTGKKRTAGMLLADILIRTEKAFNNEASLNPFLRATNMMEEMRNTSFLENFIITLMFVTEREVEKYYSKRPIEKEELINSLRKAYTVFVQRQVREQSEIKFGKNADKEDIPEGLISNTLQSRYKRYIDSGEKGNQLDEPNLWARAFFDSVKGVYVESDAEKVVVIAKLISLQSKSTVETLEHYEGREG